MKLLEKIKGIKHFEWILLLAAAGVLFVYFSSGGSGGGAAGDEARLAGILSGIDGAGKVEVFISYDEKSDAVYAFAAQPEREGGVIKGVVIIASGAGDPMVRLKLAEAARVALGVPAANVSVHKMGER